MSKRIVRLAAKCQIKRGRGKKNGVVPWAALAHTDYQTARAKRVYRRINTPEEGV